MAKDRDTKQQATDDAKATPSPAASGGEALPATDPNALPGDVVLVQKVGGPSEGVHPRFGMVRRGWVYSATIARGASEVACGDFRPFRDEDTRKMEPELRRLAELAKAAKQGKG